MPMFKIKDQSGNWIPVPVVGSSGTVDQSYDPTSPNAQSGVAVAEAVTDVTNRVEKLESYFNSDSWESVQKIVQSGLAPQMFPIGYQFSVHHDEYGDMLYDVVAHDYLKSIDDENAHTMTLLSHNIVLNAQYDASEAETDESGEFTNNDMRYSEGSNNYKESAIRQFLNSAETAGNWWQAQTNVDLPPDYTNKNGFLYGLDSEFLNVVGTVNLPCAANNTYEHPDSEVTVGSSYILQDKFYLPSVTEIAGDIEHEGYVVPDGSVQLPYYEGYSDNNTLAVKYTKEGISGNYTTRTPFGETGFLVGTILSTGATTMVTFTAAGSSGIVPMCTIV